LYLDLGDAYTKALYVHGGSVRRLRIPSVVASRMQPCPGDAEALDRERAFIGATAVLREARSGAHPLRGARLAGCIAAALGADRRGAMEDGTPDGVEALLHRVLAVARAEGEVEVVWIVDTGVKAQALQRWAGSLPGPRTIRWWSMLARCQTECRLSLRTRVVDAADCAVAALPHAMRPEQVARILVLDIGSMRSRLALVSADGCEHLQEVAMGAGSCVPLRWQNGSGPASGQQAMGRRGGDAEGAGASALEVELDRAVRKMVFGHFERSGNLCKHAAIVGGGAPVIGRALAGTLRVGAGLSQVWVASEPDFLLVDGARRLDEARGGCNAGDAD
jgi:hypothetical protein